MKAYFIPQTEYVEVQTSLVCASTDGSGGFGDPNVSGEPNSVRRRLEF